MKRICSLVLALTIGLFAATAAQAEGWGVYVAPKFSAGGLFSDNTKLNLDTRYNGGGGYSESHKMSGGSDSVFGGALAIGYDFKRNFDFPVRAEVEYAGFSEAKLKYSNSGDNWGSDFHQKLSVQTLFANFYWDFHNSSDFTPYLGVGLGAAFINTKGKYQEDDFSQSTSSKTRTNLAWNVGAGVAYDITEFVAVDLGYRFVGLGDAKTKTATVVDAWGDRYEGHAKSTSLYLHQVNMGLRFTF